MGLIDLRENKLEGELPREWGKSLFRDSGPGVLSLTGNSLTGELPRDYSAMENLQQLLLGGERAQRAPALSNGAPSAASRSSSSAGNGLTRTLPPQVVGHGGALVPEPRGKRPRGRPSCLLELPGPSSSRTRAERSTSQATSASAGAFPRPSPWSELHLEALEATSLQQPCLLGPLDPEQQQPTDNTSKDAASAPQHAGQKAPLTLHPTSLSPLSLSSPCDLRSLMFCFGECSRQREFERG